MWEERSCYQTREWQHWGSGCYMYNCTEGRLHILVGNYSYTCYYPGQKLSIRIKSNGWLHKGSILCPPCHEICGAHFAKQNTECKMREEAPPLNMYPRDDLECAGISIFTQVPMLNSMIAISIALLLRM